jgi:hypothetical protein
MAITRFQIVDYYVSNGGGYGSYHVIMRGYLETYHRKSSYDPEELYCTNEIAVTGNGASESAALADAQFRFQQVRKNYEQERYSMYNSPRSSRSSSSSSSDNDGLSPNVGLFGMLLGLVIAIPVMRSTFPSYFSTRSLFPVDAPDWITTILLGLIPIPIGWVAWLVFFFVFCSTVGVALVIALVIDMFSKK